MVIAAVGWAVTRDSGGDELSGASITKRRPTTTTTTTTAPAPTTTTAPPTTTTARPAGTGCTTFPATSYWHDDVSGLAIHPQSGAYVGSIGRDAGVKADFGAGEWDGGPIGIPVTRVGPGQQRVPVSFDYADESDPGPYPIPANAAIEGGPNSDGDRHILLVDATACRLYELFDAHPNGDGSWHAGSGAVFDLRTGADRPDGWTSADAAGLPITPGLVTCDEVAKGRIDHAIRVTVPSTQNRYVWPARHAASDDSNPALPPMGLRLRLRRDADLSGLAPQARVVAQAMQTYGVIVADNGSAWYLSGTPDERWDNDDLQTLATLSGADFEAVAYNK